MWRALTGGQTGGQAGGQKDQLGGQGGRASAWKGGQPAGGLAVGQSKHIRAPAKHIRPYRMASVAQDGAAGPEGGGAGAGQAGQCTVEAQASGSDGIWPTQNGSPASMRTGGE